MHTPYGPGEVFKKKYQLFVYICLQCHGGCSFSIFRGRRLKFGTNAYLVTPFKPMNTVIG